MNLVWEPIVYSGFNLILLDEILDLAEFSSPLLFRMSEQRKLDRILTHGTDRAGYPEEKPWRHATEEQPWFHENVILATTSEDIRRDEREPGFSTSFKKLDLEEEPLILLYDASQLLLLREKEYGFADPAKRLEALLAVIPILKLPPIPGWFSEDEGICYRDLVRQSAGETVVEVGSWLGRSSAFIGSLCRRLSIEFVCVDAWNGSSDEYDSRYRESLATEDFPAAFEKNLRERNISARILHQESRQAAGAFEDNSVGLGFLDASHDFDAVSSDCNAWFQKIRPGGILAGHDFNEEHDGVRQAVQHFSSMVGSKFELGSGSIWLFRKSP